MKPWSIFAVCLLGLSACQEAPVTVQPEPPLQASDARPVFQCPMHPHIRSSEDHESCPVCGMSLVRVKTEPATASATIEVSSAMLQSMGVRTAAARVTPLGQKLRAFGTVEADERQENVTVSKLEGWIESLNISAEGDAVSRGTLLYRVYSPELIAAQKDYINSLSIGNDKRISAVRQRLRSLGMQERVVNTLKSTQTVVDKVPVYAEADGVVASLSVREGDYVKPGTPILRLQSYQNVWVIASIPEQDLSKVFAGLEATLRFPSAPDANITGTIDYLYPTIDIRTRTGKVRIEVNNAQGLLRPGAYADIEFMLESQSRLSIPAEAILRDSRGSHVILALGDGRFGSRSIRTGASSGELTVVLDGLEDGERVVTSGQFMLDSEVNLREGLSKLTAPAKERVKP